MSEIRKPWPQMLQALLEQSRRRRRLRTGLRRLRRWKSRLLPLLPQLRMMLKEGPHSPQESQELMRLARLPLHLELPETTLSWTLETTEDLALILESLEKTMTSELQRLG